MDNSLKNSNEIKEKNESEPEILDERYEIGKLL